MAVIDQATVQLQAQTDQFDRSVEASRQKLITFDRTLEDIGRDLTTLRSGLSSAKTGFSTLDRSVSEAARALSQFNTTAGTQAASGLSRTTSSIRNLGFGFQNAGFQVSDFFVQLETGTPVARAFGQQFPQLISGFGLLGGKIGLVATGIGTFVAVGAALYSILRDGRTILERTTDLTEELAEAVQKSADAYSNLGDTASSVIDKFVELDQAERTLLELNLEASLQKNIRALEKFSVGAEEIITEFRDKISFQMMRDQDALIPENSITLFKNLTEDLSEEQAKGLFNLIQTFRQNIDDQGYITKDALDTLTLGFSELQSQVEGELPETFLNFLTILDSFVDETKVAAEETARLQSFLDALKAPPALREATEDARELYKELQRLATSSLVDTFDEEADALEKLETRLDPLVKIQQTYEEGRRALTQAVLTGNVSSEREAELLALLEEERRAAIEALNKESSERQKLLDSVQKTLQELQRELQYRIELNEATRQSQAAVNELNDAYEAETIIQRLKIDQLGLSTEAQAELSEQIREYIRATNEASRETERYKDSQRQLARALEESARRAEEAAAEFEAQVDSITEAIAGEFSSVFDDLEDGWETALTNMANRLSRFLADAALEAAIRPIVVGVLSGQQGQGSLLSGAGATMSNPLGFLNSNLTQGSLGTNLFGANGFFPMGSVGPVPYGTGTAFIPSAAGSRLTSGLNNFSSPIGALGGMVGSFLGPAVFGGQQGIGSSIGGTAGSIGASILLAGTPLGPFAPFLGSFLGSGLGSLFGGGAPSVGPTGVAITSDIFGQGLPDLITGTDNGGDPALAVDALRTISRTVRAITSSDALSSATRRAGSFGLNVGSFPNPEAGAGTPGGFDIDEIINGVKRELNIRGLSGEELLFEGVVRTLRGAFESLGSSDLDTALRNTAAESIQELVADLDFAAVFSELFTPGQGLTGQFEQALDALSDAFDEAKEKAEELGLSTELLTTNYQNAVDRSKSLFNLGLSAEASGVGGLFSTLADLGVQLDLLKQDAEAAGTSTELLSTVLEGRFAAAIEGAGLPALETLLELFNELDPTIQGVSIIVDQLTDAVENFGEQGEATTDFLNNLIERGLSISRRQLALFDFQAGNELAAAVASGQDTSLLRSVLASERAELVLQQYLDLINEEISATEEQISAIRDNTDQLTQLARDLVDFADSLLLSSGVTPLSPGARRAEALSQFQSLALAAQGGDVEAFGRLQSVAGELLDASRETFGANREYFRDFQLVQDTLRDTALEAVDGNDIALDQLEELESQLQELLNIRDSIDNYGKLQVESIEELIELTDQAFTDFKTSIDALLSRLEATAPGVTTSGGGVPINISQAGDYNSGGSAIVDGQVVDADAGTSAIRGLVGEVSAGNQSDVIAKALSYYNRYPDVKQAIDSGAFGGNPISGAINHYREFGQYEVRTFASGGMIPNLGISGADSVPIMAMPGEFILNRAAVSRFGPSEIARMNAGGSPRDEEAIVAGLYMIADSVDRLATQQASEHQENVSLTSQLSVALRSRSRLEGARR